MRAVSLIFLLVVGAVLSLPLVGTAYRIISGGEMPVSEVERRRLTTISDVLRDVPLSHFRDFATRFGEAFKDQLYLRQDITAAVNRILVFGFEHSTTDAIQLGSNGYWFQVNAPLMSTLPCAATGGVDTVRTTGMVRSFEQFRARAHEAGTKAYSIAIPLSSTLFPENLKEPLRTRCLTNRTGDILLKLTSEGFAYDFGWFSAQPEGTIYAPKSFHWSRGGASRYLNYLLTDGFLAGQRRVVDLGKERTRLINMDNASDLGVAPLIIPQTDFTLADLPKRYFNGRDLSPELAAKLGDVVKHQQVESLLVTEGGQQSGVGVLVGDSFTAAIWPYFSRHFETSYRFQTAAMRLRPGVLDEIVDALKPDYMLIVLTESKWLITDRSTATSGQEQMFLPPSGLSFLPEPNAAHADREDYRP